MSEDKGLDLGLTSLLQGVGKDFGVDLKSGSQEMGSLNEILKNSVEQNKPTEPLKEASAVPGNDTYQELALGGKWQELSKYCEDRLAVSRDLDRSAKVWWIKSQYQTGAIPVSILAPSLNQIAGDFLSDNATRQNEKQLCRELLSQFTGNLILNADYDLALSFLSSLFSDAVSPEAKGLLKDLEKKVRADSTFQDNDAAVKELQALKLRYNLSDFEGESPSSKTFVIPPLNTTREAIKSEESKKGASKWKYAVVAVVVVGIVSAVYILRQGSLAEAQFKPSFVLAMQIPEQELLEPQLERVAGLNHLDALLYEVSGTEKQDAVKQTAVAPVAMIPSRGQKELEAVGRAEPKQNVKEEVNTSYPIERDGSVAERESENDRDQQDEVPEIDFPPFRSNQKAVQPGRANPNYVIIAGTRVMSEPSYWSFSGANLQEGDKVLVEEVQGKWLKIKARNGNFGYILAQDAVKIY